MKETAIEWLIGNSHIIPKNELNKRELIQQAKEMEKQQIDDAYNDGLSSWDNTDDFTGKDYYEHKFKNK